MIISEREETASNTKLHVYFMHKFKKNCELNTQKSYVYKYIFIYIQYI